MGQVSVVEQFDDLLPMCPESLLLLCLCPYLVLGLCLPPVHIPAIQVVPYPVDRAGVKGNYLFVYLVYLSSYSIYLSLNGSSGLKVIRVKCDAQLLVK